MGDPATLVESATPPVVTMIPTAIPGEMEGEEDHCKAAEKDEGKSRSLLGPG